MGKIVKISQKGGPEVLRIFERPAQAPKSTRVVIEVSHCGVAFGDRMRRLGILAPPWTFTPGYDVVGTVISAGAKASLPIGQRVISIMPNIGLGGYAEEVTVDEKYCRPIPEDVSGETVLALGLNYISAYQMLFVLRKIEDGMRIFVHGISGNVGQAVLQLLKGKNCKVCGTCSSGNFDLVRSLGGTPVDYRQSDWVGHVVREQGRFDLVMDGVGGENLNKSLILAGDKGRVIFFGMTGDVEKGLIRSLIGFFYLAKAILFRPSTRVYAFGMNPDCRVQDCLRVWGEMIDRYQKGTLPEPLTKSFLFEDVQSAHRELDSGSFRGKIVLIHRRS